MVENQASYLIKRGKKLSYQSKTCADLHDKATGLYLYGDLYIVDEVIRELQK